ncbi:MAG: hypothetical protein A2945_01540 [Candidatus Liptonbacteria bacterium RIFCSPLOWO2_01_FULL_52_25]|uniref:Glycosidase n=1 Tax=Candidatus Liptonbacteria bacterium RIFCSPLOWO2_01_FULL_52_25 TaxID=1798650 RepID=A0A1G2CDP6_9BACT|nr:MAG: hypothetical protein A2945_01540 [Candidatus Liptonbacteria bacterium RIFCSPLOWO2_01_FULL_52_25]
MFDIRRFPDNPVLKPNPEHPWEAQATFNPSVVESDGKIHLCYRAVSSLEERSGIRAEWSSIGYAVSSDGIHFDERRELIAPEEEWEKYGTEDPRITKFEGVYYIFYTALSRYPFSAEGIKIGVAMTKDFKTFEKHPVTPFNAKAMALFPERVNGKIAAVLTVNTDNPPSKVCLALFDTRDEIWSEAYWKEWYKDLDSHVIPIERGEKDHLEVGAVPFKTDEGWLLFYSYIYNYFSPPPTFGVEAALLDFDDPRKIIGEVKRPFIVPQEDYERYGKVPNIIFPSGAITRKRMTYLYYGAADTTSCVAAFKTEDLVEKLLTTKRRELVRFEGNPIISPVPEHDWESKATFNPGAIYEDGKVHILYRAMNEDNTSVVGYAASEDGVHIAERLPEPVFMPREDFEQKRVPGGNSGCEDPRLTKIGDTIYMCYTAFDGQDPPRVALTSIALKDFLEKKWNWSKSILISPPGEDDKDAALFPKKINGKFAILHRLGTAIWLDYRDDLEFKDGKFLKGEVIMKPRETAWDSKRIGIAGPPVETEHGWLLIYHGIGKRTSHYHVRAALLDLKNPAKVLYRFHDPILEPKMPYEKEGVVSNVVFPCGTTVIGDRIFTYYGGADKVVCVATTSVRDLVGALVAGAKKGGSGF